MGNFSASRPGLNTNDEMKSQVARKDCTTECAEEHGEYGELEDKTWSGGRSPFLRMAFFALKAIGAGYEERRAQVQQANLGNPPMGIEYRQ